MRLERRSDTLRPLGRPAAVLAALSLAAGLVGCDSPAAPAGPVAAHVGQATASPGPPAGDRAHLTEVGADEARRCAAFKDLSPPASDKPDEATAAKLAKCDTESLLYGIGTHRDVVRARQSAFAEKDSSLSLGSDAALMTLYANGWGVKRDLDLAAHFACRVDGAPAETKARLDRFAALKAKGAGSRPFDTCDDITSGLWGGICNAKEERIMDLARDQAIREALSGWNPPERAAYKRFAAAQDKYIDAQAGEVDASGAMRAVFWQEAAREINDRDLARLRRFNRPDGFAASPQQRAASDRELNLTYQRVMKAGPDAWEDTGTVKPDDVRTAQRGWIKYRDAWLDLATAKGRSAAFADGLAMALTDERAHDLRCLMQVAKPAERCESEDGR